MTALGRRSLLLVILLALTAGTAPFSPRAVAARPGTELQRCGSSDVQFIGFSDALNTAPAVEGIPVGELSGAIYDRKGDVYYVVSDRAGATQSHFFTVRIPVETDSLGTPAILDVTTLRDPATVTYTGATLDAEGVVLTRDGIIVASEGGSTATEQPEIRRFSLSGNELESLAVPSRFLRTNLGGQSVGTNLAFESLALSPSGQSLFTANEGPLVSDGKTADNRGRIRILRYDRQGASFVPADQFYFLTEVHPTATGSDLGVVEIVALSETDLLVMERSFVPGQGNTARVFQVSLKHAADVSQEATLGATGLEPVEKTLLFDLATCPPAGATVPLGATQTASPLLDNFEAMALGPKLPGGRQTLLLISDNNLSATQTTRIVAVAVPIASLMSHGGN